MSNKLPLPKIFQLHLQYHLMTKCRFIFLSKVKELKYNVQFFLLSIY